MKKVLVLYYSQSGQLQRIVDSLVEGLKKNTKVQCDCREIKAKNPYPYPWPFYSFFNVFPEAVHLDGCAVEHIDVADDYDLIVLGYTIWFLSPSIPVTGFLQTDQAVQLFKNKPVVTVIGCRDMWLIGQEKMKDLLAGLNARLLDNVVLTDQGKSLYTFVTTPRWMLTGKKDSFWFFPKAGVAEKKISATDRFGLRLGEALAQDKEQGREALLSGLGAVNVSGKLIATERCFLLCLVVTVVPLNMLIRKVLAPLRKKTIARAIAYYEQPSGR